MSVFIYLLAYLGMLACSGLAAYAFVRGRDSCPGWLGGAFACLAVQSVISASTFLAVVTSAVSVILLWVWRRQRGVAEVADDDD